MVVSQSSYRPEFEAALRLLARISRAMDDAGHRPPAGFAFSAFLYRYRNLIERFFGKLKHARGLATRYDKRADNFLAAIKLFSARIWINAYESTA